MDALATAPRKHVAAEGIARPSQFGWIAPFQGLRAVAVLAVVIHHCNSAAFANWAIGNIGVGVFFSLSGFLAYYVLRNDEIRFGRVKYNFFLFRRILRIWPAYFAVIAIVWLTAGWSRIMSANQIDLFTFTVNWSMGTFSHWPMPALTMLWTIAVEQQFYIVAPLMYAAIRSRYGALFCVAVFIGANCARAIYVLRSDADFANGGLYYLTYTYADTFLVGAIVAHFYMKRPAVAGPLQAVALSLAVIAFVATTRLWGPRVFPPYDQWAWVPYALLPLACALLLYSVLPGASAWYKSVLSSRLARIGGEASYGLYLVHILAIQLVAAYLWSPPRLPGLWDNLTFTSATLVISGAIVAAIYFLVENPLRRFKARVTPDFPIPWPAVATVGAVAVGLARALAGL